MTPLFLSLLWVVWLWFWCGSRRRWKLAYFMDGVGGWPTFSILPKWPLTFFFLILTLDHDIV